VFEELAVALLNVFVTRFVDLVKLQSYF